MLPPGFKNYKHAETSEGSRNYFHQHAAELWSFRRYFNQTHNGLNKFKKYTSIVDDYLKDLDWILNQSSTPAEVKDHVVVLKSEKTPGKSTMKAEAALPRKTRFINNKNTFNISGDNNNIGSIQLGDRYGTDESNSSNMGVKRKFNGDLEERNDNKKLNPFEVEEGIEENNSILGKWDNPEYHRIIRSGKTVSSKPFLDKELYDQHVNEHKDVEYIIPEAYMPYIANVMKQDDLKSYRKAIRTVPEADNEDENALLFLENLFQAMYIFHTAHQDIHDGESAFNSLFLYPFLKAVARAISTELDSTKADFCDGEVCLESMSKQLKSLNMMVDDRNMYKADGVIRMYGFKRLEVLFLETSYHFGSTDQRKSKFDHHKGLFGALAMLKTIADEYQYGSLATFRKIKVFFVHAADRTVYLWSMLLVPEGSIYDLWLEDTLEIKPDIGDKLEAIPNFHQFYWKMKELLKETSRMVMELKKEHDSTLMKNMFKSSSCLSSLSLIVNPSILHLTEEEDKAGMAHLGPLFSPKR